MTPSLLGRAAGLLLGLGALSAVACGEQGATRSQDGGAGTSGSAGTSGADGGARCEETSDCAAGVCETSSGACVACLVSADCPADQECADRSCVPSPSCTNSRDCDAGLVCDASTGRCVQCLDTPDCGPEEVCAGNLCRGACVSDRQCTGAGLLCDKVAGHCVACLTSVDCATAEHCAAGVCHPDVCAPGAARCAAQDVEVCNEEGSAFTAVRRCAGGETCSVSGGVASCEAWVCTPDVIACDASAEVVRGCAPDGLSAPVLQDCGAAGQVCVAGECRPVVCQAGQRYCQGSEVRTCSAKGDSSLVNAACTSAQFCDSAASPVSCRAKLCQESAPACDGNLRTTCNAEGSGYTGPKTDCGALYCVNGACETQLCTPNSTYCELGTVRRCAADGLSSTLSTTCSSAQFCEQTTPTSAACRAQVCSPGQPVCNGATATTCNQEGSGYLAGGVTCGVGQHCVGGACQSLLCQPNALFCSGGNVRRCSSDGTSSSLSTTCTNGQLCDDLVATPACRSVVCAPHQPGCNGNSAAVCNALGTGYTSSGSTCGRDLCVRGACSAQVLFYDGLEHGDTSLWNPSGGGARAIRDGGALGTSRYLEFIRGSDLGGGSVERAVSPALSATSVAFSIRGKLTTSPGGDVLITDNNGGIIFRVWNLSGGACSSSPPLTSPPRWSANTWHRWELRNIDWTAKTFDVYLDSGLVQSGLAFADNRATSVGKFEISSGGSGAVADFDELEIR